METSHSDHLNAALSALESRAKEDLDLISSALERISKSVSAGGRARRIAWGQALYQQSLSDDALQSAIGRRWLADNCQMAAAVWRPRRLKGS